MRSQPWPGNVPNALRPDVQIGEALAAQQLAVTFLVKGCERALFDLRCSLGRATDSRELRTGLLAVELLEAMLADWREARALLDLRFVEPQERLPPVHCR